MQGNPKENSLHFLGFPWSNQDFSMGYSEKNRKNFRPPNSRLGLYFALTNRRLKTVIFL
jgi:hypothetical protein